MDFEWQSHLAWSSRNFPSFSSLVVGRDERRSMSARSCVGKDEKILDAIFQHTPSITHIKRFRLVNKIWDKVACSHLQNRTQVNLLNSDERELARFWRTLQINRQSGVTSPFRKYAISIQVFPDDAIEEILEDPATEIRLLTYITDKNITYYSKHFSKLYTILHAHGKALEIFNYTFCNLEPSSPYKRAGSGWMASELDLPDLHLPALQEFNLYNWNYKSICEETSFSSFLFTIILSAQNLRTFSTNTDDPELTNDLMEHDVFSHVRNVYLKKVTLINLPNISKTDFRHLHSLGLIFKSPCQIHFSLLSKVLESVSVQLEELAVAHLVQSSVQESFPEFPNLRRLLLHECPINLGSLHSTSLPKLRAIYLINYTNDISHVPYHDSPNAFPHDGVEEIGLKCVSKSGSRGWGNMEQQFISLLRFLSDHFPRAVTLNLSLHCMSVNVIESVVKLFSPVVNLKLEICGECVHFPEKIFTGREERSSRRRFETFPSPCLRDLKRLKRLNLSINDTDDMLGLNYPSENCLTTNSVVFGIKEIPKLKILELNLGKHKISPTLIRKHLRHLRQVIIALQSNSSIFSTEELVFQDIGNVTISKSSVCNEIYKSDEFDFRNYF